jgi:CHASE3 domain sensor protein
MEGDFSLVGALFAVTFALVIAYALYTYFRTKKAQHNHEESAEARVARTSDQSLRRDAQRTPR